MMPAKSRIAIDPIACEGHGICAELLPELIVLDDWGFPIVRDGRVSDSLSELARRAERLCPTLALKVYDE